jgi:hypothetical protein
MYILTDEAFNSLTGGEYVQVIIAKKQCPELSIAKLYNFQFDYFSYQGFRKFYKKVLEPIINCTKYIPDDSIAGRFLKGVLDREGR